MGFGDYDLLSIRDAGREIGWSEPRLRKVIERGQGPKIIRSGRRIEIARDELKRWFNEKYEHQGTIPTEKENQMTEIKARTLEAIRNVQHVDTSEDQVRERQIRESFAPLIEQGRKTRAALQTLDDEHGSFIADIVSTFGEFNIGADDRRVHTIKALADTIHRALTQWPGQITSGIFELESMTLKKAGDSSGHDSVTKVKRVAGTEGQVKGDIDRLYELLSQVDLATWIRDRREILAINAGRGTPSPGSIAGELDTKGEAIRRPGDYKRRQSSYKIGEEEE